MRRLASALAMFALSGCAAEQRVDADVAIHVAEPYYAATPPRIVIDAAHQNFHTADGRYEPFARLLRADGARVDSSALAFSDDALAGMDVLVIANAAAEEPATSAFDVAEIAAVRRYVENGGALLLIADHMPFAGWSRELGEAFGVAFDNGFAVDGDEAPDIVSRANNGLADDPLTCGVQQVRTFTGSSFTLTTDQARPLLRLDSRYSVLFPEAPWEFTDSTPKVSGEGRLQGAVMQVGAGRVAVFAEAAMFTAQITEDGDHVGLGAPGAESNQTFLLNVIHWLTGERS